MTFEEEFKNNTTIIEVARLIKEFQENFKAKTSQEERFLTMSEIETLWSKLRNKVHPNLQ